jgi:hypothetical protein
MRPWHGTRRPALAALWLAAACAKAPPPASGPAPTRGPDILTLEELDQDHGKDTLFDRNGIADINSSLELRVDSTALRRRVSAMVGPNAISPAVIARLAGLQAMAVARLELVQKYSVALQRYTATKSASDLQAVRKAIKPLAQSAGTLIAAASEDPALGDRLETMLETFYAGPEAAEHSAALEYNALLAFAGEEAASARRALDAEAHEAGVRIQIGTWLSTSQGVRPIAAPTLNQTEPSSPFVVDRWTVVMDDAQRKQVQEYGKLARAANTDGPAGLLRTLAVSTRETFKLMADQARECAESLTVAVKGLTTNAGASPQTSDGLLIDQLKAQLTTLQKSAKELTALAVKYQAPATTTDPAAFLEATNADLAAVKTIIGTVAGAIKQARTTLAGASASLLQGGELANGAAGLKAKLGGCDSTIHEALDGITADFGGVDHAEQIRALTEEAWKDVLSFDVATVPARSTVQLVTAGPRRPGDLVLIRIAATRGSDTRHEILDEQQVRLQRVLPHLELSVGLVFADPLGSSAVIHRFQAAPAYSVLYRRGSRRSMARNSFWNVGIGLNIAAVDFDKDDVPELGLGLTTSAFADLLQAGAGYNVFLDRAYWFFGVRLPVGIVSLAGNRTPVGTDAAQPDQ